MKKTVFFITLFTPLAFTVYAKGDGDIVDYEDLKPRSQPIYNSVDFSVTTSKWDLPENRHYSFSNFENLHPYPSIISKGTSAPYEIPVINDGSKYLKDFNIKPWENADAMNLPRYLYEMRADAFIVMKDGKLVYEVYPGQLSRDKTHTLMSSSKTLAAMIISQLIEEGELSLDTKVKDIIPELGSAFDDVSIHQALNMNVTMKFSEDYTDPNSEGMRIFAIEGWSEGESDLEDVRSFLKSLTSEDTHANPDRIVQYNSAVASVLGWVIQNVTGMNFNNAVSYYLFKHIGASEHAVGLNDHTGYGHASGYVSMTARDAALLFSAYANDGVVPNGSRIMPKGYVKKYIFGDEKVTIYPYGTTSNWQYSHLSVFNRKGV